MDYEYGMNNQMAVRLYTRSKPFQNDSIGILFLLSLYCVLPDNFVRACMIAKTMIKFICIFVLLKCRVCQHNIDCIITRAQNL